MKHLVTILLIFSTTLNVPTSTNANEALDQLLEKVRQDKLQNQQLNKQREQRFINEKNQQKTLLTKAKKQLQQIQIRGQQLQRQLDDNEQTIIDLTETLRLRVGDLGDMFGEVRKVANDQGTVFYNSLSAAQFPERDTFLNQLSNSKTLPVTADLEKLWITLHEQMTESGRSTRFPATVIQTNGKEEIKQVTRLGLFNAISEGAYLNYLPQTGKFEQLQRQPKGGLTDLLKEYESSNNEYKPVGIDPSRGDILNLIIKTPSVLEKIHQGKIVGYIILTLGALGLLLSILRLLLLNKTSSAMGAQLRSDKPLPSNPLGRAMQVYLDNKNVDTETLELKLDESIMKDIPDLEKGVGLIKLIASVAPLLGLLGTVIGMIHTFQAITLHGTSDPKLMADGISAALVTTMLGLSVAIPLIFLHNIVHSKSRTMVEILEEQCAGFVAKHAENKS